MLQGLGVACLFAFFLACLLSFFLVALYILLSGVVNLFNEGCRKRIIKIFFKKNLCEHYPPYPHYPHHPCHLPPPPISLFPAQKNFAHYHHHSRKHKNLTLTPDTANPSNRNNRILRLSQLISPRRNDKIALLLILLLLLLLCCVWEVLLHCDIPSLHQQQAPTTLFTHTSTLNKGFFLCKKNP